VDRHVAPFGHIVPIPISQYASFQIQFKHVGLDRKV